jgi:hypothetical protein
VMEEFLVGRENAKECALQKNDIGDKKEAV